jgi:septum site-determining protein MinC
MNLLAVDPGEDPLRSPVESRGPSGPSTLPAAALMAASETALVVTKTLRSGQAVRHDGDVILLGDVNPGAEVIAAGHIVVMGALRGLAHAGCTGNRSAFVAAVRLRPTQLRIAGVVGRAPDQEEPAQPVPEVARLRDGMIVIEAPATR